MSIREHLHPQCTPNQVVVSDRLPKTRQAAVWARVAPVAREVLILAAAIFAYFFIRGLINGRESLAFDNAERVIAFERSIGLFVEDDLQGWIISHTWLVDLFNTIYIYGHWPVIVGTFIWLLTRHRPEYLRFRNAVIISGAVAFVFFGFFPTAPPRFLTEYEFIDTVTERTNSYRVLQPPALANKYAAVPSLHFGWNLLMGIALATLAERRWVKLLGWLLPALMFAAIVLTANHYLLDGVIGGILALGGLLLATKIPAGPRPAPKSAAAPDAGIGRVTTRGL